jgi:hypothetical protein
MIKKDISELPVAPSTDGNPPASESVVATALAEHWFEQYVAEGNMDKARAIPDLPYRASYASKRCDRALYYALSDTPESEPITISSAWTMGLGTLIHEHMQKQFMDMFYAGDTDFDEAEIEPTVDLTKIGIPGSGHADLVVWEEATGERVLVEIKSTSGFPFKMMATRFKGAPEGPRFSYVLQAAMMAKALDCTKFIIALITTEPVSAALAENYSDSEAGRFAAEWVYNVADVEDMIEDERVRVNSIVDCVRLGDLPRRTIVDPEFPDGATVTSPLAARAPWVVYDEGDKIIDSGQYWGCAYCSWRTQCHEDG